MRKGVRLGIDVGSVRVGVARSDPAGVLASPVETIQRRGSSKEQGLESALRRIAELVAEHGVLEVIVGMPKSLSGREGPSGEAARQFGRLLAPRLRPVPVRLADERFSTVTAERTLQGMGVRGTARRSVVDQEAATVILQAALDAEKASGSPPGEVVQEQE